MPLDYDAYRRTNRFASLDGVRAIAAVAVVLFHFGGPSFAWASGWLGVHVFFVLSGFLITTLALREEERRGRISLRNFYTRRVFRIWPAYFAVLGVLVGLFVLRDEYVSRDIGAALPWYLSFNVDLWPHGDILYIQTWTIGIEQKFYLVWPLLAFLPWLPGLRHRRLALMAVLFAVGAALWGVTDGYVVHYLVIAVGCLVAVVMHDPRTFRYAAALARPVPAALCWTTFAVYQLAVPTMVRTIGAEPPVILGYGFAVAMIMPSLLVVPALGRVFGGRVMTWWGERSYSLYLVQGLAGWLMAMLLPVFSTMRLMSAVAVVITSALLADLLYRGVELPFIRLGRRLTSPRSASRRNDATEPGARSVPDGQRKKGGPGARPAMARAEAPDLGGAGGSDMRRATSSSADRIDHATQAPAPVH